MSTFVPSIELSQEFIWNISNSVLYWYLVSGQSTSNGSLISLTVAATDLYDLCSRISSGGLIKSITSIQQFARPVRPSDIAAGELSGNNYNPNVLTTVSFLFQVFL